MQDKKFSLPSDKLAGIHYNAIKAVVDEFFEELVPKLKDGKPITTMGFWPGGKKGPNQHYKVKIINTKNKKELAEFGDKKLSEYLNPGPTEIPVTVSLSLF